MPRPKKKNLKFLQTFTIASQNRELEKGNLLRSCMSFIALVSGMLSAVLLYQTPTRLTLLVSEREKKSQTNMTTLFRVKIRDSHLSTESSQVALPQSKHHLRSLSRRPSATLAFFFLDILSCILGCQSISTPEFSRCSKTRITSTSVEAIEQGKSGESDIVDMTRIALRLQPRRRRFRSNFVS